VKDSRRGAHVQKKQAYLPFLSFEFCFCFFSCGCGIFFFYDDDDEILDTRTLFDDFLMKEILAGRFDDFLTTNFLTIFSSRTFQGEEPLDTGGGPVFFSLDASSGLLATRRRLGRWGDSFAMRSAFVV